MENIICIKCLNEDTIITDESKITCSKCGSEINLHEVGKFYLLEDGVVKRDVNKAIDYFTKASSVGNAEAAYDLAVIYGNIRDYHKFHNKDKCVEYLAISGELGLLKAQKVLAYYYEDMHRYFSCTPFFLGKNELFAKHRGFHDLELAQYWYNKAASQGDEESKGALVKYDYAKDYVYSEKTLILSSCSYVDKSHYEFFNNTKCNVLVLGESVAKAHSLGAFKLDALICTAENGLRAVKAGYRRSDNCKIIYTSGNFLKGNYELLEGCIYIFNNWEAFADKDRMLKNFKSKSDKIRKLLIELANSPKRGRSLEILLEHKLVPYDILVEYSKLSLTPAEGLLVLKLLDNASEKDKKKYKAIEERSTDLDLGVSEYTAKEFKKVFNCVIKNGVIELNKCNSTDEIIILPASIEGVSKYQFNSQQKNTSVKKIYFEEGVTSIDISYNASSPLSKFVNLEEVHLPSTLEYATPVLFYDAEFYSHDKSNPYFIYNDGTLLYVRNKLEIEDVIIPEGVKNIPDYMFENMPKVKSVVFPSTIEEIGIHAFKDCKKMASITFSDKTNNALVIGEFAFKNNFKVKEIKLPEGLTTIDDYAFDLCKALKKITLPSSLEFLGNGVFHKCRVLKELIFAGKNENFILDNNVLYSKDYKDLIQLFDTVDLTQFTVPNNVKVIKDCAFEEFANLKEVILPEGLEVIGDSAFRRCPLLKNIVIPSTVKEIHDSAFRDCKSIEVINLPEGVERINYAVFKGCVSLHDFTLPESTKFINGLSFANCPSLKYLDIPVNAKEILSAFDESEHIVLYTMLKDAPSGWKSAYSYYPNDLCFSNKVMYGEKSPRKNK